MGPATPASLSLRELTSSDDDYLAALHIAATARSKPRGVISLLVEDLLRSERNSGVRLRPLLAAYEKDLVVFAVVGVESPGASNLILVPFELASRTQRSLALPVLREPLHRSKQYGVKVCQVIGPNPMSTWGVILREAGLSHLTDLIYLTSQPKSANTESPLPRTSFRWDSFSQGVEKLFGEAIALSYLDSQDCPELIDARSAEEALRAHRCVGEFDPALWFVLSHGQRPLGILLMCKMRREPVIEIVYMGVSQPARGRGVADVLMAKAREVASHKKANLILAVDARNEPARKLYGRWNFVEVARRCAWIANLHGVET